MSSTPPIGGPVSPLVLADRLLTLAQQADQAGLSRAANDLLSLIDTVLAEPPAATSTVPGR